MDIFEKLKKLSAERETAMGKPEYIIVGLGNPGVAYDGWYESCIRRHDQAEE